MIDIDFLKKHDCIIYEVISGSKAYGLDTPSSDRDIRGVFILPEDLYYGFEKVEQVSDETNDVVYYELNKFFMLLAKSNPTVLEMLSTPKESVLIHSELFPSFDFERIFSRECYNTFGRYAWSQVKKARGLNKKILNPMDKKKKSIMDFCTVIEKGQPLTLISWAEKNGVDIKTCGLNGINRCKDLYSLFWEGNGNPLGFSGIVKKEESTRVALSSVPETCEPKACLSFNNDGFIRYCKEYREYWEWVEKRNETRFHQTLDHGKRYDAKNMMHTFRLLLMAREIVTEKRMHVYRHDREYFLSIKEGVYSYDELLNSAEEKIKELEDLYKRSDLRESPDRVYLEETLISLRKKSYRL